MIQEITYPSAIFLEKPSFQNIWKKEAWFFLYQVFTALVL